MTESFDSMLAYDPLLAAETETGHSYKDSAETMTLGVVNALLHSERVRDELALRQDSYYGMPYTDFLAVAEELGFEKVLELPTGDEDTYHVFWRDGLLLASESYGDILNSADLYFNAEFAADASFFKHSISGHLHNESYNAGIKVWVGVASVVEAFKHKLAKLEEDVTFLTAWLEDPLLYLVSHHERGGDWMAFTRKKYAALPEEVRRAVPLRDGEH